MGDIKLFTEYLKDKDSIFKRYYWRNAWRRAWLQQIWLQKWRNF
jgi:hypothetical protein